MIVPMCVCVLVVGGGGVGEWGVGGGGGGRDGRERGGQATCSLMESQSI